MTGRKSVLVKTLSLILVLGWAISAHSADLIVIGDVYTMDASAPKAEAIAVAGGRLVFVGDARRARALLRPGGRTIELAPGQSVLPGFVDSHVHMIEGGVQQRDCPIEAEPKSKEALAAAIKDCAAAQPEKAWLIGNGWPAALFDELGPRKEELDALVPDRPAVIYGDGGHSAWLNSAAFLAAGIGPDTEDPPLGRIERQPDSQGEATRTVRYVTRAARDGPGRGTHPAEDRRGIRGCTRDRAAAPARVRHHARAGCPSQPALPGCLSRRGDVRGSDHEGGRGAGDRSAPASLAGR